MLVNTSWLAEYINGSFSRQDLLKVLASTPLEVEGEHVLARELQDIVVGFIREKNPLPESEGMYICRADVGAGRTMQVVCASEHPIEVGWGVPVAKAGMKLPTGIQIKSGKFHGVVSEGMICLDSELGMLASGTGLQIFHDESLAGQSLVDLISVTDALLDLRAPANRPDLLSLVGIAREVAAIIGLSLRLPAVNLSDEDASNRIDVEILEPTLCARYTCRLIRNVKVGKSPPWLSSRLRSAGVNPINNVVDVTNFVMHEFGQPLHAFDFTTLRGPRIVVRKMRPEEEIELLDGTMVSGKSEPLVIADAERPVALAGIMGGKSTQINAHTTEVLLEAAYFHSIGIKQSLKELKLDATDAAYRFARGVDPNLMLELALDRAASLISEVASSEQPGPAVDVYPEKITPRHYILTPARVSSYLGRDVSRETIQRILQDLEMQCSDQLEVVVPTWRFDANDAVVLIEDVARLTGYDQIPLRPPTGRLTMGQRNDLDAFRSRATDFLINRGFLNTRNLSLESPRLFAEFGSAEEQPIRLVNSTNDMSVLRRSLLPGLLDTAARNARRDVDNFEYFEVEKTFGAGETEPIEKWTVAAIMGGSLPNLDWSSGRSQFDFFRAKGIAEEFLEALRVQNTVFQPANVNGFRPGTTAVVSHEAVVLGVLGEIDPARLSSRKLHDTLYGFEFDLRAMHEVAAARTSFEAPPRTPAVTRDLAFILDDSIRYAAIESKIREMGGGLLEEIRCTDVYEGTPIPAGRRSISVRLRFRSPEKTLSSEEVSKTVDQLTSGLAREFDAQLRSA